MTTVVTSTTAILGHTSILAMIQSFSREYGLPVPTALQGTSDAGALQLREVAQTVGEYIWQHSNWQQCARTTNWVSLAGSDQGDVHVLCDEAMSSIIPRTFWDMTIRQPFEGPLSDLMWQSQTANNPAGPLYSFRVAGGRLLVSSNMPAGHNLSMIYKTRNWILSGGVPTTTFLTDADTCYFPDSLMKRGIKAFWLRTKQMPHALEFQLFEDLLLSEASLNIVRPILRLDGEGIAPQAGILIPLGNWTV